MGQLHSQIPLSNVPWCWEGAKHTGKQCFYAAFWGRSPCTWLRGWSPHRCAIKDPYQRLSVSLSTDSWTLNDWTQDSPPQHIFWHYTYYLCGPTVRITFLLTLASGRNIWKSLKLPLSGSNTAVRKGKRAVLLESLFKESDSRRVPPTSAPANREPALSCSQTSQARPFLHTRQKNAHGCSLLLPQTQPGMFGRKAEMTGTPIRLPYLEKIA